MQLLRKIVHIILLIVNVVIVAALLLAAIAGIINPTIMVLPSLLGLAFEWIVLLNIFMCIVWLFTTCRRYVFISVIGLLISIAPIVRTYNFTSHRDSAITENNKLKVLTYNTLRLGKRKATTENQVLQYIKSSGADIVFLQEYEESVNNKFLTHDDIISALSAYPYHYTQFRIDDKTRKFGVAIFSKYKLFNFHNIEYESTYNGAFKCDALVGNDIIHLICVHLESNQITGLELDQPVEDAINNNTVDFNASAKTIIDKLRKAYSIRTVQANIIIGEIGNEPRRTILCGDFNDVPVSYTYHTIVRHLKDAFAEAGPRGFGHTFKRKWLHVRIDYILHSSDLKAYNLSIDNNAGSDHYPVCCTFAWD